MIEALQPAPEVISFGEYLEREKHAGERHEFVDGRMFAMAGASENHEIVAGNLFVSLHQHLAGDPCRVFKGDMKLKITLQERDLVYYPDIMITCDSADKEPLFKTSPKVLIEVMSDYKTDHVEKLFAYQQIPSLEEYLVLNQDPGRRQAWLYRRAKSWVQEEGAPDGVIELASVKFSMKLEEAYGV